MTVFFLWFLVAVQLVIFIYVPHFWVTHVIAAIGLTVNLFCAVNVTAMSRDEQ